MINEYANVLASISTFKSLRDNCPEEYLWKLNKEIDQMEWNRDKIRASMSVEDRNKARSLVEGIEANMQAEIKKEIDAWIDDGFTVEEAWYAEFENHYKSPLTFWQKVRKVLGIVVLVAGTRQALKDERRNAMGLRAMGYSPERADYEAACQRESDLAVNRDLAAKVMGI